MWYDSNQPPTNWRDGEKFLRKADATMKKLIAKVGPCHLAPRKDYFIVLCTAIFNQQVSMAAAASMFKKFRAQFPRQKPTPALALKFLQGSDEQVRACGISRQKRAYLIDLSKHFLENKIPVKKFAKMSDDQIIEALTAVHGIGRWTAEMFLIFILNRPDVWPVDDVGLIKGYVTAYGLPARLTPKQLAPLGEPLRPWRTLATWYLWRGTEG